MASGLMRTARSEARSFGRWAVIAGAVSIPFPVMAEGLMVVGGQLARDSSDAYLVLVQPILGGLVGSGPFLQPAFGLTSYSYRATTKVQAHVPSIALGLGYAWVGEGWGSSISLSPGYQYTFLQPRRDEGGERSGTIFGRAQISGTYDFTPIVFAALSAVYAFGPRDYSATARIGYRISSELTLGPAIHLQGGPKYQQYQAGLQGSWKIVRGLELTAGAGYVNQGAYGLLGMSIGY